MELICSKLASPVSASRTETKSFLFRLSGHKVGRTQYASATWNRDLIHVSRKDNFLLAECMDYNDWWKWKPGEEGSAWYMSTAILGGDPGRSPRWAPPHGFPPASTPSPSLPVLLVDLVPKAHRANDGELQPHVALLEVIGVGPELDTRLCVGGWLPLKLGVEQGVHEGRFAQTCLS